MGNEIVLGKNVKLRHCVFTIHGTDNHINIQDNCRLSGLRVFTNSSNNTLLVGKNTIVNAGKNSYTLFNACDGGGIFIGDNCLFSNSIEIHTTDYHKVLVDDNRTNMPQDVHIGSHCWVGLQTLILKGTTIANDSIVGARSLLNKEYNEPNTIIVGNPARIVNSNVEWDF